MNNKGFAITGILYTIFILFIMTLLAILSGLNTRTKILKKSIEEFEKDNNYTITEATNEQIASMNTTKEAAFDGKYIFDQNCEVYLKKGKKFSTLTSCNTESGLKEAYKFNKEE